MKKYLNQIISFIAVGVLWVNYYFSNLSAKSTRTFNLNGYGFEEAPNYFKHLDFLYLRSFLIEELLIIVTAIFLIYSLRSYTSES